MYVFLLFFSIAIAIVAQLLFKLFALTPRIENQAFYWHFLNANLILGMGLYFISALLYVVSLQKISLSVAYPTVAVSYVFIVGLSYFFFGESLTIYKILGSALILIGVALMWQK
jgi:drug/metabolite transporter (DMT)-like permease